MGKSVHVGLIALFFATLLVATRMSEQSNKPTGKFVGEFGETIGEAIDTGFLFFDGKYIDAPYTVSRKGIELYINDCKLHHPIIWPPTKEDDQIPPPPKGLTADSTIKDLQMSEDHMNTHDRKVIFYMLKHYELDEAYDRIVAYYKSLPFVKDAKRERSAQIRIECKNGEVVSMFVGSMRPKTITKESVLEDVEWVRNRFEERLKEGDCFYLFSNGGCEISFGRETVKRDLSRIVKILQSDEKSEIKKKKLEAGELIPSVGKPTDMIISNFVHSEQLETRLKALEAERTENIPLPLPPEENKGPSDFEKWQQLQKEIRERFDKK